MKFKIQFALIFVVIFFTLLMTGCKSKQENQLIYDYDKLDEWVLTAMVEDFEKLSDVTWYSSDIILKAISEGTSDDTMQKLVDFIYDPRNLLNKGAYICLYKDTYGLYTTAQYFRSEYLEETALEATDFNAAVVSWYANSSNFLGLSMEDIIDRVKNNKYLKDVSVDPTIFEKWRNNTITEIIEPSNDDVLIDQAEVKAPPEYINDLTDPNIIDNYGNLEAIYTTVMPVKCVSFKTNGKWNEKYYTYYENGQLESFTEYSMPDGDRKTFLHYDEKGTLTDAEISGIEAEIIPPSTVVFPNGSTNISIVFDNKGCCIRRTDVKVDTNKVTYQINNYYNEEGLQYKTELFELATNSIRTSYYGYEFEEDGICPVFIQENSRKALAGIYVWAKLEDIIDGTADMTIPDNWEGIYSMFLQQSNGIQRTNRPAQYQRK